jgi:hypothetical protein
MEKGAVCTLEDVNWASVWPQQDCRPMSPHTRPYDGFFDQSMTIDAFPGHAIAIAVSEEDRVLYESR